VALGVSVLDMDSHMPDLEMLLKLVADFVQELVIFRRLRHDKVNG
jgi:hypothetical protein